MGSHRADALTTTEFFGLLGDQFTPTVLAALTQYDIQAKLERDIAASRYACFGRIEGQRCEPTFAGVHRLLDS